MLKTAASEAEAEATRREDVTLQLAHGERARSEVRGYVQPLPDALRVTQHLFSLPQPRPNKKYLLWLVDLWWTER